jgi:hypothetical protein
MQDLKPQRFFVAFDNNRGVLRAEMCPPQLCIFFFFFTFQEKFIIQNLWRIYFPLCLKFSILSSSPNGLLSHSSFLLKDRDFLST